MTAFFFATYFEATDQIANPDQPHDHGRFDYTRAEMEQLGESTGWRSEYIGDWNHPRGQIMMRYRPADQDVFERLSQYRPGDPGPWRASLGNPHGRSPRVTGFSDRR